MRHLAHAVIVAMLALNASGVIALVAPEPCAFNEAEQDPDGQCAPTCARCGCCARPVVPMPLEVTAPIDRARPTASVSGLKIPPFSGRDILHVPKL